MGREGEGGTDLRRCSSCSRRRAHRRSLRSCSSFKARACASLTLSASAGGRRDWVKQSGQEEASVAGTLRPGRHRRAVRSCKYNSCDGM